jgi:Right handed beta helix region
MNSNIVNRTLDFDFYDFAKTLTLIFSLVVCLDCYAQSRSMTGCLDVRVAKTNSSVIENPGTYCLKKSYHVDGTLNPFKHGNQLTSDDDVALTIAHDDVVLDLQGFKLTSDAALDVGGIQSPSATSSRVTSGMLSLYPKARFVKNILVKNGSIELERYGIGIRFMGYTGEFTSSPNLRIQSQESHYPPPIPTETSSLSPAKTTPPTNGELEYYEILVKDLPKTSKEYPNRAIQIENMTIRTQSIGVVVQGGGTIIRNSVIETFGSAAIWIYGPNALIENNTIIIHSEQPYLSGDAAIRLYHGDGAVIRNNKIIVKGSVHKRAVSTIDTGPFVFEGNTLTGITETDKYAVAVRGDMLGKLNGTVFRRARPWPFN